MDRPSSGSVRSISPFQTPQHSRLLDHSFLGATPLTETPATSASIGRGGTPASDRVLSGRVKKSTHRTPLRKEDVLSEKEKGEEQRQLKEMIEEVKLFPRSDSWADDEFKLFKILFMRQYSPLLPGDWQMSFRGIPIPDILFASSVAHPPIINTRSGNDFKATKALARLIDLTREVRGLAQTGQRHRASALITKRLQEYAKWAEHDGEYDTLDYVPNIIIDAVDTSQTPQAIEEHMQNRLRIAAASQRAHWRAERAPESGHNEKEENVYESEVDPEEAEPEDNRIVLVPDKYPTPSPQKADLPPSTPHRNGINGDGISEHSSPSENSESAEQPDELWAGEYTRRPPVIYGLFVVNTSVMVLTIDSAKEQDAAGSYQVEVGFSKRGQDVWNAITIAIVVCLARDTIVEMRKNFETSVLDESSDPDA
ncbi:hypothetical protein K4K61_001325 [Colletotrichum sp. SAR11_59]|nr:hypothetical protein K4K61_001325 [Colletotrichum sp. SAR11_59]